MEPAVNTNAWVIIQETWRALGTPRRFIPILVVSTPLVWAQTSYSRDPRALPVGLALCVAAVLLAPASWRALVGEMTWRPGPLGRLALYALGGGGLVWTLGRGIPSLLGMGETFLTQGFNLLICVALYWVGGWGLARDIDLEVRLQRAQARAEAFAKEAEMAQLMALRSHLDPHFLFNTLNAIAEWCREDGETAERAVLQLSAMLRAVLAGVKSQTWPLRKEAELIQTLFALHQMRDPNLFTLTWDVPDHALDVLVPPMVLLPLAENAVKHGPAAGHRGTIVFKVTRENGRMRVRLENPGPYKGPREGSDGLPMVKKRLALAYDGKAVFSIAGEGDRTTVCVDVPEVA